MRRLRVQVLLPAEERALFEQQAAKEGMSLSAWFREAGRKALAERGKDGISSTEELVDFFRECESREQGNEPDWEDHLEVIETSRGSGGGGT